MSDGPTKIRAAEKAMKLLAEELTVDGKLNLGDMACTIRIMLDLLELTAAEAKKQGKVLT